MCAYPSPAFEGAEKRLELHFVPRTASAKPGVGLRAIPKAAWDRALKPAQCCIVSHALPCKSNSTASESTQKP